MWQVWQWTWSPLFIAALPPWHVPFIKTFQNVLSPRNHSYYQSVFSNLRWNPFVSQGLLENPKEKTTFLSKKLEGSNLLIHLIPWKLLPFIKEGNEIQSIKIKYVIVFKNQVKSIILQVFSPRMIETFKNEFLIKENVQMGHFLVIFKHCDGWLH